MAKAEADLRAHGFTKVRDGEIVTIFTPDPSALLDQLWQAAFPTLHAQTTSKTVTNGYVVISAWNDGDNRTWEGNIYARNNTFGTALSVNGQWSDKGEYTPINYWAQQVSASGSPTQSPKYWHGGKCGGSDIGKHAVQHALQSARAYCATAMATCALTAPVWWQCSAIGCIGSFAKSLVDEEMAWAKECSTTSCGYYYGC